MTHTQRWHAHHGTAGTGHLYQGRYKSFPVQSDEHLLTVCRYVERNALRAEPGRAGGGVEVGKPLGSSGQGRGGATDLDAPGRSIARATGRRGSTGRWARRRRRRYSAASIEVNRSDRSRGRPRSRLGSVWSRCSAPGADHENNRTTAPDPFAGGGGLRYNEKAVVPAGRSTVRVRPVP